jgi:hypothetical protein
MTTGRPRPILPEQPSGGNDEKDSAGSSPPAKIQYLPGVLKQLFRDVKKALTSKPPAPQPTKQRRRREEETRGGFRLAGVAVMRRVARSFFKASNFPWEPPDQLDEDQRIQRWHENNIDVYHAEESEHFHYAEQNHLSLKL